MEQLSNSWWLFILLGVFAGIISGTLGIGSGTVIVPALVLFFRFAQKSAQGMALAVMVPMALVGAFRYWRNPTIDIHPVVIGLIVCGGLVGALVGVELASRLPAHVLRKIFAVFLLIVAVRMFINTKQQGVKQATVGGENITIIETGDKNNEKPKQ